MSKIITYIQGQLPHIDVSKWCALRDGGEEVIESILKPLELNTVVEIGTFQGVTSVLLAKYCKKLITIDIHSQADRYAIWDSMKIDNIDSYIVRDDAEKAEILKDIDFDLAFIDGNHNNVIPDIEMCRKCGRLLFDDYDDRWGVKKGIDATLSGFKVINKKNNTGAFVYYDGK